MTEFNELRGFHDENKDAYLNLKKPSDDGLCFEIREVKGNKRYSLVLTKEKALDLSEFISEYYIQQTS